MSSELRSPGGYTPQLPPLYFGGCAISHSLATHGALSDAEQAYMAWCVVTSKISSS